MSRQDQFRREMELGAAMARRVLGRGDDKAKDKRPDDDEEEDRDELVSEGPTDDDDDDDDDTAEKKKDKDERGRRSARATLSRRVRRYGR